MLDLLVGQFVQSGPGKDVLAQLSQRGLEGPQAQAALTATAEGAMQQGAGPGGAAGMLGGLMGGAAPSASGLGGLVGMLGGGAAAGAPAPAGGALGAMGAPVAQVVAQKTGLSPAIAQMVVSVALPKLLELISSPPAPTAGQAAPAAPAAAGGLLGGLMGGLLK